MQYYVRRPAVWARRGMVATSEAQAAMAGLQVLREGGNAVDAAVATSAALCVTEPMSTGIGGDMFALVWSAKKRKVYALNGSGRAPRSASLEELRRRGLTEIPQTSPYAVSVPGVVDGWWALLKAHGTMRLSNLLKPAIRYAQDGFVVPKVIARAWEANLPKLARYPSGSELMLNGRAPRAGEVMRLPQLANTLRDIAKRGPKAFYKGRTGEKIAAYVRERGGWLDAFDLANHRSTWDEPISTEYRGVTCWECPPNGQGLAALIALNIIEGLDIRAMGFQSADTYHHLIEAMRLAFADALQYIADPRRTSVPVSPLLSKGYAGERRSLISYDRVLAQPPAGQMLVHADTAYLTVIDGDGNACSFINSLYEAFGTGLVVPGTGVVLQNRASLFSLDPDHPNALEPEKRPYHTIIPGMATRDGELWLSFGVMGGFMQPQGHLQVLVNMIDFGLDPQEALDALRFCIQLGDGVAVEEELPVGVMEELRRWGHTILPIGDTERNLFGGGQIIERDTDTGVLLGGSEPRKDGCAIGW
ncbi:MAG: gamma-glutamyltransferase [Dehalococcoidia bacterium]